MNILKNTFLTGLVLSLSVVATDYLTSIINHTDMSVNGLIVAGAIAVTGYVGKFLTGATNTNVSNLGAAVIAIVPLITTGAIDWKLLVATFALKIVGLFSAGRADANPSNAP